MDSCLLYEPSYLHRSFCTFRRRGLQEKTVRREEGVSFYTEVKYEKVSVVSVYRAGSQHDHVGLLKLPDRPVLFRIVHEHLSVHELEHVPESVDVSSSEPKPLSESELPSLSESVSEPQSQSVSRLGQ